MSDIQTETRPGRGTLRQERSNGVDKVEKVKQDVSGKAQEINNERDVGTRELKKGEFVRNIRLELAAVRSKVNEAKRSIQSEKQGVEAPNKRHEAEDVKLVVLKYLESVKQGLVDVPYHKSKTLLTLLADKNINDQSSFSSQTFVFLHELIHKYSDKEIEFSQPGTDKTEFEQDLDALNSEDTVAAGEMADLLIRHHTEFGLTRELAESKFNKLIELGGNKRDVIDTQFEREWQAYRYSTYFRDPDDKLIIKAFYSPETFYEYIKKIKAEVIKTMNESGQPLDEANGADKIRLGVAVSDEVRMKIAEVFSKLFNRIDVANKNQAFEELIRRGFPDSQESVFEHLRIQLGNLYTSIQRIQPDDPEVQDIVEHLYLPSSKTKYAERVIDLGDNKQKTEIEEVIVPTAGIEKVKVHDFVIGLERFIETEVDSRSYFHNLQVLFNRAGGGKEGFFAQLSGYAEQFKAVDIDKIQLLPDGDLIMSAVRLYQKYLEEKFVIHNYIHQPNMFVQDFLTNNSSEVQKDMFEDLKRFVRVMNKPGFETAEEVRKNDWRLQRAMTFAMGISKGLVMSEPELAAWADPVLKDGKPTYASFYGNDATALDVLNPLFSLMRFQAEGMTLGPLAWTNVYGEFDKVYDHTNEFVKIKEFRESFKFGLSALRKKGIDEKRAFEVFANLFSAGSLYTRGGWRNTYGWEGWMRRGDKSELKAYDSWKALEHVGSQVLISFAKSSDFTQALNKDDADSIASKKKLFEHLYDTYIKEQGSIVPVDQYIKDLEKDYLINRKNEHQAVKSEQFDEAREKKLIHGNINNIFINNAISHIIAKRSPTKFLRIQRDRMTLDGVRGWSKLRKELYGETPEGTKIIDRMMKNIILVEEKLRADMSVAMRKHLDSQADPNQKSLHDFNPDSTYVVDKDRIRAVLKQLGEIEPGDIEQTVTFYQKMMGLYKDEKYLVDFTQKLNDDAFPFAIGNDDSDFTFLAHRAAGGRILARTLGDTAQLEQNSLGGFKEFMGMLPKVATTIDKKDFMPIVEAIHKTREQVTIVHGLVKGNQVAQYMAHMAVTFFKEDTKAEHWWTKAGTVGKPSSLAAEFAGGSLRVWEWDTETINNFVRVLETQKILPSARFAHGLSSPGEAHGDVHIVDRVNWKGKKIGEKVLRWQPYKTEVEEEDNAYGETIKKVKYLKEKQPVKLFGQTLFNMNRPIKNELPDYCSDKLKGFTHSNYKDIAKKFLHTYGPAFFIALSAYYLRQAAKEEEGKKQ